MRHLSFLAALAALTFLSVGCSPAPNALNTIEFVVLDKATQKPVSFAFDMSGVPNKTLFSAELSLKEPSRITWAGPKDLPISLSADGYETIKIDEKSVQSFKQVTTAPRIPRVVTFLMVPTKH